MYITLPASVWLSWANRGGFWGPSRNLNKNPPGDPHPCKSCGPVFCFQQADPRMNSCPYEVLPRGRTFTVPSSPCGGPPSMKVMRTGFPFSAGCAEDGFLPFEVLLRGRTFTVPLIPLWGPPSVKVDCAGFQQPAPRIDSCPLRCFRGEGLLLLPSFPCGSHHP